jgi:hypothetical protein
MIEKYLREVDSIRIHLIATWDPKFSVNHFIGTTEVTIALADQEGVPPFVRKKLTK